MEAPFQSRFRLLGFMETSGNSSVGSALVDGTTSPPRVHQSLGLTSLTTLHPTSYSGHPAGQENEDLGDSSPVTRHCPAPCPPARAAQLSTRGKEPEARGRSLGLPICLSRSAASSGVARGRTPGSLKLVRSRVPITKKNRMPPTTGMAGVIFTARYGQLPAGWEGKKKET